MSSNASELGAKDPAKQQRIRRRKNAILGTAHEVRDSLAWAPCRTLTPEFETQMALSGFERSRRSSRSPAESSAQPSWV